MLVPCASVVMMSNCASPMMADEDGTPGRYMSSTGMSGACMSCDWGMGPGTSYVGIWYCDCGYMVCRFCIMRAAGWRDARTGLWGCCIIPLP